MAAKKKGTRVEQFPPKWVPGRDASAFGQTLREYRLKAKLDQEQISRVLGLTKNTISNWERGVSRPDLAQVPEICKILNMSLYDFFRLTDPNPSTPDERGLVADYREMSEPNKRQFRKVATAILESQEETRRENYRQNYRMLKGHDSGLAAGFGVPLDNELDTYPVFVRNSREARMADDVFPINGQSMEPDYPDGSMVFVKRTDADDLSYGDIIACTVSGIPYVKIYEKDGLHSINKDYSVIHISDDDTVRLIGRVVGSVPEDDLATGEEKGKLLEAFADELK